MQSGVFYTLDNRGMQQGQQSIFHQVQKGQLGKKYDPSSILSAESDCNINQVRNPDGSITATITRPGDPFKDVIKTDTTGKVVVQENTYDNNDKLTASAAIDNDRISTRVQYDDGGPDGKQNSIETRESDGTRISLVWWNPQDGSVEPIVEEGIHHGDEDNAPITATSQNGMKTTVKPFHAAYPNPNPDDVSTTDSNRFVFRVINPDSSVKAHMVINPDGTVQPGPKWTAGAPVEPADPANE
jgi:hypothetical protein